MAAKIDALPFDASQYLDTEEMIAEYLNAALEEGGEVFLAALGDVIKAKGVTKVAKEAGVDRESLYQTLSAGSKPRCETIEKLARAARVKLAIQPLHV